MNRSDSEFTPAQTPNSFKLRLILSKDNEQVAQIIRTVMTEFACVGEGYSILDPEVDNMAEAYSGDGSVFFVVENPESGQVFGCGGIGPLAGGDGLTCELKKMYFLPELRGVGFGKKMVKTCLEKAKALGYRRCYLETVDRMVRANQLYKKMGFERIGGPMGATGHSSCDAWYMQEL